MARKRNCVLRMTVNVDLTNSKEVMFIRAMLRRLNVLHAAAKPNLMPEILQDGKLRDRFDQTRQPTTPSATTQKSNLPTVVKPPADVRVFTPTNNQKILRIVERKMELLNFTLDSAEVDNAAGS